MVRIYGARLGSFRTNPAAIEPLASTGHSKFFRNHNTNIVGATLIDQALALLAPTLEAYKGCNIVSIPPINTLWTEKIAEYLQPWRHIVLTEVAADTDEVKPEPLRVPSLSCRHEVRPMLGHRVTQTNAFWREMYADLDGVNQGQGRRQRKTLVLANYTRALKQPRDGRLSLNISYASLWFYRFFDNIYSMPEFYDRPLPRVLVWMANADKHNFIPRTMRDEGPTVARYMREYYKVREIAGTDVSPWGRRDVSLEIDSALRVAKKMQASGIELPPERRSKLHQVALTAIQSKENRNPLKATIQELEKLKRAFYLDGVDSTDKVPNKAGAGRPTSFTKSRIESLSEQLEALAGHQTQIQSRRDLNRAILLHDDLLELERDIAASVRSSDTQRSSKLLKQHAWLHEQLQATTKRLHKVQFRSLRGSQDNSAALKHSAVPLLDWDQRDFEPVQTLPEDIDAKDQVIALLDFMPQAETPSAQPCPDEATRRELWQQEYGTIFRHPLIRTLTTSPRAVLEAGLENVAHGASLGLIPNCPSLWDPLQGGRMTLGGGGDNNPWKVGVPDRTISTSPEEKEEGEDETATLESDSYGAPLRHRMLTIEQCYELLRAWRSWPFRMSDQQLRRQRPVDKRTGLAS